MPPDPSADKELLEQAARLRLAVARLARVLRQRSMSGLTPSQLSCLTSVEALEPVRLADLAAREAVAPPTLTRIVAAMVDIGLVERKSDPADARAALITTTAEGRAALQRVREERTAHLVQRLAALPDDQIAHLVGAVTLLEALVGRDAVGG